MIRLLLLRVLRRSLLGWVKGVLLKRGWLLRWYLKLLLLLFDVGDAFDQAGLILGNGRLSLSQLLQKSHHLSVVGRRR